MGQKSVVLHALSLLWEDKRYLALSAGTTISIFVIYALILNWSFVSYLATQSSSISLLTAIASLTYGVFLNLDAVSLVTTPLTALLAGISVSLLVLRYNRLKKGGTREGTASFLGILAGSTLGCPACTGGVLAIAGATGWIAALPFNGEEIKVLSVVLLASSIYFLSKGISNCDACKIG